MYCDLHCKKHHILVQIWHYSVHNRLLLADFVEKTVCLSTFSMHQRKRAFSETQAGFAFSTRLTFACVVFAQRTPGLQPQTLKSFVMLCSSLTPQSMFSQKTKHGLFGTSMCNSEVELQIGLKDYDTQRDKRFAGVGIPHGKTN